MARYEDNYFDLAIVDPPYGIDVAKNGNVGGVGLCKVTDYGAKDWDSKAPDKSYFIELKRISKNQIIWGANHFIENIPKANSSCWIVWDKDNSGNFADSELAYTSFKTSVRNFKWRWYATTKYENETKKNTPHRKTYTIIRMDFTKICKRK
jgi:site-specific DNA-methyltransferase (adenine-specific)